MHISKLKWGSAALAAGSSLALNKMTYAAPLVVERGMDFQGGGQALFGSSFYGRDGVNMIYALPTGNAAIMTSTFKLDQIPNEPLALELEP